MLSDMTNELTPEQQSRLDALIAALKAMPSCDGLFSPYASATGSYAADSKDEVGEVADRVRTDNFRKYATALLLAGTDVILCGEAPGWAGCRHSGIAFSDEKRIAAQAFPFTGCELLPLAAAGQRPLREEQSARIVWGGIERAVRAPLLFNTAIGETLHHVAATITQPLGGATMTVDRITGAIAYSILLGVPVSLGLVGLFSEFPPSPNLASGLQIDPAQAQNLSAIVSILKMATAAMGALFVIPLAILVNHWQRGFDTGVMALVSAVMAIVLFATAWAM